MCSVYRECVVATMTRSYWWNNVSWETIKIYRYLSHNLTIDRVLYYQSKYRLQRSISTWQVEKSVDPWYIYPIRADKRASASGDFVPPKGPVSLKFPKNCFIAAPRISNKFNEAGDHGREKKKKEEKRGKKKWDDTRRKARPLRLRVDIRGILRAREQRRGT